MSHIPQSKSEQLLRSVTSEPVPDVFLFLQEPNVREGSTASPLMSAQKTEVLMKTGFRMSSCCIRLSIRLSVSVLQSEGQPEGEGLLVSAEFRNQRERFPPAR